MAQLIQTIWSQSQDDLIENLRRFESATEGDPAVFEPPEIIHIHLDNGDTIPVKRAKVRFVLDASGQSLTVMRYADPFTGPNAPVETWDFVEVARITKLVAYWYT